MYLQKSNRIIETNERQKHSCVEIIDSKIKQKRHASATVLQEKDAQCSQIRPNCLTGKFITNTETENK